MAGALRPVPVGPSSPDRFAELRAPAHWQAVDFISDLHLQAGEPATFACWQNFMQQPVESRADALFILGDLFEVWVGDDLLSAEAPDDEQHRFRHQCVELLHSYSRRTPVYFMAGNRDFLLGPVALESCGMQGLQDPTVLLFLGQRFLLSHGDALCLEDLDYMRFRAEVRSPAWQRDFLARPLRERETVARELREQSEARKASQGNDSSLWADLDPEATRGWLRRAQAHTLIHGHTHRPAQHDVGVSGDGCALQRVVLSDWEATSQPARAEVLRLDARGLRRMPLPLAGQF